MKVLYVINSFNRAGAEKLVYNLSLRVKKSGADVAVAAIYRTSSPSEAEMCDELNSAGIKTYILDKTTGKKRARTVLELVRIIRTEKPDVLHAHCSVPMIMGKFAGLLCRVPVVCTVHNTRGYHALRERLTSWMVKRYVSIGASAEEYMCCSLHIKKSKIERIYNAVDMADYRPSDGNDGFWRNEGFEENVPVAINVGRVVPQKNQLCFVKAIKECIDRGVPFQAAILGDYSENSETYSEIREFIDKNGLEKTVRFLGNKENIVDYLCNAECFVMTSEFEGLSVAYLEAAACNVPIVSTELPFAREIEEISPGSVITAQNDHREIADVLCRHTYNKRSDESLTALRAAFSFDGFVEKHLELYSML